ncbi:MAG: hypothetical protein HOA17_02650 [Candidatus Melainabacteria bacterium]|jgi:hypothetical protein|nr:hypothetical protein [Candidatus Melainabacteria bacterium]
MQVSSLLVVATTLILCFSSIAANYRHILKVLEIDLAKLNQSIQYLQDRNSELTNIDLINLELQ